MNNYEPRLLDLAGLEIKKKHGKGEHYPAWQAFEEEGEGKERTAGERGGRAWKKGRTLLSFRFFYAQILIVKIVIG